MNSNTKLLIIAALVLVIGACIGGFVVDKFRTAPAKKELKAAIKANDETQEALKIIEDSLTLERRTNRRIIAVLRSEKAVNDETYEKAGDRDYTALQRDSLLAAFWRKVGG